MQREAVAAKPLRLDRLPQRLIDRANGRAPPQTEPERIGAPLTHPAVARVAARLEQRDGCARVQQSVSEEQAARAAADDGRVEPREGVAWCRMLTRDVRQCQLADESRQLSI